MRQSKYSQEFKNSTVELIIKGTSKNRVKLQIIL